MKYAVAKRYDKKVFKRWKNRTLKRFMMFSPCYGGNRDFEKLEKWRGPELNWEESVFVLESYNVNPLDSCSEKEKFLETLKRKDTMSISIEGWKKEIQGIIDGEFKGQLWNWRFLQVNAVVESLKESFPENVLKGFGIIQMLDEVEKQTIVEFFQK